MKALFILMTILVPLLGEAQVLDCGVFEGKYEVQQHENCQSLLGGEKAVIRSCDVHFASTHWGQILSTKKTSLVLDSETFRITSVGENGEKDTTCDIAKSVSEDSFSIVSTHLSDYQAGRVVSMSFTRLADGSLELKRELGPELKEQVCQRNLEGQPVHSITCKLLKSDSSR